MLTTLKTIYDKPSKLLQTKSKKALSAKLKFDDKFLLESGEQLTNLQLAYTTYGTLNEDKSNVIWICHALTANSEPHDWWAGLVGNEKLFDPKEHFIVCANLIGSPYGTQFECKRKDGTEPLITIRDNIKAFIALRKYLEIEQINTLIGGSIGGHQALEWAIIEPEKILNLVLCATSAKLSPWAIAFNETQRLAIQASSTNRAEGLKVARAIALLSYRNSDLYNNTQEDNFEFSKQRLAEGYQRYQGEKFADRFDAQSYRYLTKTMDSHDVGRGRGGVKAALQRVKAKTLVIAINSDILFSKEESEIIAENIPNSSLQYINSKYGHDGFLIEHEALEVSIKAFYKENSVVKNNNIEQEKSSEITLFGLGCVGEGFYELHKESVCHHSLRKLVVKNTNKNRSIDIEPVGYTEWQKNKELSDIVIELINNDEEAYEIATSALVTNKKLVSASKKMIADNLPTLVNYQAQNNSIFLYEAAVAASIPILRLLNDYHDVSSITSIQGILNGSSNFILSEMTINKTSYQQALDIAIKKGFAELDPSSDVGGFDAKYKTVILALHGFGLLTEPEKVINLGIENIKASDIEFATNNGWVIKPIASIRKYVDEEIAAYVLPEFLKDEDELANVHFEENAIKLQDKNEDFIYTGKGAGKVPTGMAVLADVKAAINGYRYQYQIDKSLRLDYSQNIKLYVRKKEKCSWRLWDGQIVLAESGNIRLIETQLDFIQKRLDRIRADYFIAKLPD